MNQPALPDLSRFRKHPVSFVRRSGRLTDKQQRAWDERGAAYVVEVPRDVASTSVDPAWTLDLPGLFGRTAPVVLEIGSGLGECVAAAASSDPARDYVAVEVYEPGLATTVVRAERAARALGQDGLPNLRLVQANAAELLDTAVPPGSLDELWVFFPDPWHKSRHHKRRLVTESFARSAARALRPGGTWRLATDWAEYAGQMVAAVEGSGAFRNPHGPGRPAPRFEGRVLTSFERKGHGAGRGITDLEFVRL